MFASVACLVKQGDHVVASASMFSSCYVVLTEILPSWGVTFELVEGTDEKDWAKALNKPTQVVFIESPSNPLMEIVDIAMVSKLAHKVGATVIVDNVMASPVMQKPLELGADVVMYSATKHIDGQGRVLGGAILGSREYIKTKVMPFARHTGPSMSAFNAWVLLKSLETMTMRERECPQGRRVLVEAKGHQARFLPDAQVTQGLRTCQEADGWRRFDRCFRNRRRQGRDLQVHERAQGNRHFEQPW
jgi:O-succinylhomoserine sulfhydrylase